MAFTRRTFLKALIWCLALTPLTTEAATFHAIIVGDTSAFDIGSGAEANIRNITKEMNEIAEATGMDLELTRLTGSEYNSKLLQKLKKLSFDRDDAVLFYYTGHGFRESDKNSQWPNIFISHEVKGIDQELITKILQKKKPRFLISFVNSCNSVADGVPIIKRSPLINRSPALTSENYKKLFKESSGTIITSSSSPGQYSWIHLVFGDFYTNAFLESLHEEVYSEEDPNWEIIFQKAIETTRTSVLREVDYEQVPQVRIVK